MMHVVVEPFPFAGNGYTLENLNVGDKRDFGASTDGLLAAGLIAPEDAKIEAAVEPVVAPVVEAAEEPATEEPIETAPARRTRK